MEPKRIGKAKLIAFTNTNHYEPHIVSEYWFGRGESETRPNQKGRFEALPFAIVLHRGRRYACGLHRSSEAIPLMESLDQREVLLYEDARGRLWFCACEDMTQHTKHTQPIANEKDSAGISSLSQEDEKEIKGPVRTILFTDIEGSTLITNRLKDKKARELFGEHEKIIRAAVSTHGGTEIKTTGDGIMAEFPAASGAIDAAMTMQREITERFGGRDTALRIRIGINTGEPVMEAGDLHGASVNLAARVMSEAEGGQIFVTETVRNLVSGKLYEFVEQRPVLLRGFDEPIKLFEVLWTQEELLILGLTGKAGSGFDSDVADILRRCGSFEIIRADKVADATWELPEVRRAVAETFGKEKIFENTSQDDPSKWVRRRGVLGEIVASDPALSERLSDILNPYATAQTFAQIRKLVEAGKRHIAVASTRLTNKEHKLFCHQIWYVDRKDAQRQKALLKDYSGRQLAEAYVSAKVDQVMRLQRDVVEPSDFPYDLVIEHTENEEALTQKVTSHLRETLHSEQRNLNGAREFSIGLRRGQFVRSMLSLAQIMEQPIRLRSKNLFSPRSSDIRDAIKACIEACVKWSGGNMQVAKQDWAIEFWPGRKIPSEILTFKLTNELSVSLLVVTLIPLCLHHDRLFQFVLQGCTDLNHSSPCDYYKNVLFPLLRRLGIDVRIEVEKRGFWEGEQGCAHLWVQGTSSLQPLNIMRKGKPQSIKFSQSSVGLDETFNQKFVERMSQFCEEVSFTGAQQFETDRNVGGKGKSVSMSVAVTTEYSILGADAVCDKACDHLAHEELMSQLVEKTKNILDSPAALDYFTADKIILYLALAGGAVTIPISDDMEHIYAQLALISWFHKGRIDIKCNGDVLYVEMDPML